MAKTDYQAVLANWGKRAAMVKARGLPDSTWKTLAQHDVQNVLAGHAPMSDQQAADALLAGVGKPVIKDPQVGSSWTDIPGNIAGDVQGLVSGFIPGLAHYATTLPEQIADFGKLIAQDPTTQKKYGMETEGGFGAFIRDMSRTPVFGPLIPGLHTAAAATTEQGRTELAQHPASAAVDVLYAAKEGGRALAPEDAAVGTAAESFAKGNPVRGTVRAAADQLAKIPKVGGVFDRVQFNQQLLNLGLHSDIVENLSRPINEIRNAYQKDMRGFIEGPLTTAYKDLNLTDDQQRMMAEIAYNPGVNDATLNSLPPEHQSVLRAVRSLNEQWSNQTEGHGTFKVPGVNGKMETFSQDEPVVKAYRHAQLAEKVHGRASTKLQALMDQRTARSSKLESRYGKVRRFGESDAEFAKRQDGPVTPDVVAESAAPLVESFANLDPLTVYRGIFGDQSKQSLTAVLRDVKALSGETGLLAKWNEAMKAGDLAAANKLLTEIKRRFDHTSWEQTPYAQRFRDYVREIRKEMVGIRAKMRSTGFHMRTLSTAIRDEKAAIDRAKQTAAKFDTTHAEFAKQLASSPPAKYEPMLVQKLRDNAVDVARTREGMTAQELDATVNGIRNSTTFQELRSYLGEETANQLISEIKPFWMEIARGGTDPIFVHNVSPSQLPHIEQITVIGDRYFKPSVVKQNVFDIGRTVHNVLAAVTDHKRQLLSGAANEQMVRDNLAPLVQLSTDVEAELTKALIDHPRRSFMDPKALVQKEMANNFVKFDPERYGFSKVYPSVQGKDLLIPKGYDRALRTLMRDDTIPINGVYDKVVRLWKMSILTLPRHLSHIALGGTMMMALRHPMDIAEYGNALEMIRQDSPRFQSIVNQHVNDLTTDQLVNFAATKSIGRIVGEAVKKPIDWLNHKEEMLSNMQKVAVALGGEKRGLSTEAAIRLANKTIVDMNSMLPIERVVLRQIFPFYGFTRHLFRYVMTYPIDHPLKASILTNLANQHREEWASGLPQTMSWLFFLGTPDKNGNVTGIDYRSIDPFRSAYNDFSLAGLTSGLNPIAQTALTAIGVNTLSATPELYPQSHYDPNTGTIVSERPQTGLAQILEQILPPMQGVDALIGITDKYRNLKATNPRAYRNAITTALGIPFAPSDVNVPYEKEKAATKRYSDAQKSIAAALTSGNFDDVKRYNQVPVPSLMKRYLGNQEYASPAAIEAVYEALVAQLAARGITGVAPKAVLPKPVRRRTTH